MRSQLTVKWLGARALLLMLSIVLALALAEVIVRAIAPQPLSGSWREATSSGLLVNKSSGESRHQSGDRVVRYRFCYPHLRGTPRVSNAERVLALGDSFTFGWLLDEQDTYVHHLQNHVDAEFGRDAFRFLNAAAGGWGTADCLAFLEEFGDLIKPCAVVVFLSTDDIGRSLRGGLFRLAGPDRQLLVRCDVPGSRLKRCTGALPGYQFLLEHSHFVQILRRSFRTAHSSVAGPADEAVGLGNAMFLGIRDWCRRRGIALYVTTTGRHDPLPADDEPTRVFMRQADAFFAGAGIPYMDISPAYFAVPEEVRRTYSLENDGHPSPVGSKFIADRVWDLFLRERLRMYRARRAVDDGRAGREL